MFKNFGDLRKCDITRTMFNVRKFGLVLIIYHSYVTYYYTKVIVDANRLFSAVVELGLIIIIALSRLPSAAINTSTARL